jgi:hypothetical protein
LVIPNETELRCLACSFAARMARASTYPVRIEVTAVHVGRHSPPAGATKPRGL